MKVAIMQPYFFPYIGYFQLIDAVDKFVIYDDVNYINRSWINRNYILSNADKTRLTLQLEGASQNRLINQITIGKNREKLLKAIRLSYAKAPWFLSSLPIISNCLLETEDNLAIYLEAGIKGVSEYLGIQTEWYLSSDIEKDNSLRGQEKILAICRKLGATQYINLPGGRELYTHASFAEQGVELSFIEPSIDQYEQNLDDFIPYLSIIDVMMFNNLQRCKQMVKEYEIV